MFVRPRCWRIMFLTSAEEAMQRNAEWMQNKCRTDTAKYTTTYTAPSFSVQWLPGIEMTTALPSLAFPTTTLAVSTHARSALKAISLATIACSAPWSNYLWALPRCNLYRVNWSRSPVYCLKLPLSAFSAAVSSLCWLEQCPITFLHYLQQYTLNLTVYVQLMHWRFEITSHTLWMPRSCLPATPWTIGCTHEFYRPCRYRPISCSVSSWTIFYTFRALDGRGQPCMYPLSRNFICQIRAGIVVFYLQSLIVLNCSSLFRD